MHQTRKVREKMDVGLVGIHLTSPSFHWFRCSFILEFLASAGVTLANYGSVLDKCGSAISLLTSGSDFVHRSGGYVQKFVDALKVCTKRTLSFISLFILLLLSHTSSFLPACLYLR